MKGFLIILGFWVGVAGITSAATLAEAQRLENFGLYSLAEELYVKMEGSEGVLGLLRTRLAQKDSDGALEALNNNRELLGGNRSALYELLALLQQNKTQEAKLAAAKIKREGLDAEETDWANLALGLLAYNDGAFDVAESYWREISFSEEALAYAMSLYPKLTDKVAESALNKKASKELQKRLKRMKADDWGIYKFYILTIKFMYDNYELI